MDSKKILEILANLAPQLKGNFDGGHINLMHDKISFEVSIIPGAGHSRGVAYPTQFDIRILCGEVNNFTIRTESFADVILKKVGLSSEVQTGDVEFDAKYFLSVEDEKWGKIFFDSIKTRECVERIFASHFSCIIGGIKSISARKIISSSANCPRADEILEVISQLRIFTREYGRLTQTAKRIS